MQQEAPHYTQVSVTGENGVLKKEKRNQKERKTEKIEKRNKEKIEKRKKNEKMRIKGNKYEK